MTKKPSYETLEKKIEELEKENLLLEELQQSTEELLNGESRYRAVIENQTEMICCFQKDGIITFVNDAYCRYFNKNREELIGHKFLPFIPDEDREKVFESISSLNPNKPIVTNEHRVFAPNGEVCWHKWANQAIFDEKKNLLEYQAVGWDITERKQAEETLRMSEEKYRNIFQNIQDVYYETSLDGFIMEISPSVEIFSQYNRDELIGTSAYDLYTNPGKRDELIKDILAKGKVSDLEINITDKDGSQKLCSINVELITDGQNNPLKLVGSIRDITKHKQAEEALQESEIKHKTLVQNVPGMVYRGYADWSAEIISGSEEICGYTNKELNSEKENWLSIIHADDKARVFKEGSELAKRKQNTVQTYQKMMLSIIESNLNEITSPLSRKLSVKHLRLTPTEIKIANLIRHGTTTKEIAEIMKISPRTVDTHRKNIRRKIGLDKKRANLRSFLLSMH